MRTIWLMVLAGAMMFPAVQSRAQDAENIADTRCIIVGIRISQLPSPAQQNAGTMAALYYLGRLNGRSPALNLEELMLSEIGRMTAADYDAEAKRCGGQLTDKGQELTRIGKSLVERGQKLLEKPAEPSK